MLTFDLWPCVTESQGENVARVQQTSSEEKHLPAAYAEQSQTQSNRIGNRGKWRNLLLYHRCEDQKYCSTTTTWSTRWCNGHPRYSENYVACKSGNVWSVMITTTDWPSFSVHSARSRIVHFAGETLRWATFGVIVINATRGLQAQCYACRPLEGWANDGSSDDQELAMADWNQLSSNPCSRFYLSLFNM